jgi:hypothetical protein
MTDDVWETLVPSWDSDDVTAALDRVRGRAAERRGRAARRWRLVGLAAAFIVTFGAGLLAGRLSGGRHDLTRMWALGGGSVEANRASFVAVPRGATP